MTLDERIAQAMRHVETGRQIVERQRVIVESKVSGPYAASLLESFERSQQIFESDLDELLRAKRAI